MKRLFVEKPIFLLLVVFVLYIATYITHATMLKQTVYGDGAYYFSWLHTIFFDHDMNFSNEYVQFNLTQPFAPNGLPINKYAIGPSILWAPFYLFTHAVFHQNGYTFPYQFIVGLSTVLYVIVGFVLLYRLLCTYTKPPLAVCVTLLIALATNLLFYGAIDTVNSHGLSFFVATLFLTFLLQKQSFSIGIALGFLALIRPQDGIYALILLPYIKVKNIFPILLGFILVFGYQLPVWYVFTGNPFVSPYFAGGETYTLLTPHIFQVLFSLENGLFVYTPLCIIAGLGYIFSWKKYTKYKWVSLLVLLVSIYLVSSWSSWNQGASYSGRMFVGLLPLLAFPLASVINKVTTKIVTPEMLYLIFVLPLGAINGLLIFYFLLTHH